MTTAQFLEALQTSARKATGTLRADMQSVIDGAHLMAACGADDETIAKFVNGRIDRIKGMGA